MKILSFETSCDETSIALLELDDDLNPTIVAEEILSQTKTHVEYGGVVPELAAREHMQNLPLLYDKVLNDSKVEIEEIDLLSVTAGPGLKGCLLMGLSFAQAISTVNNKEIVGVNHIEGHILAGLLNNKELSFPYLALVVSGGHTEIVQVNSVGDYKVLSRTTDDAAGEAFDKSAHLLGFSYPGGPQLANLADTVSSSEFSLPIVMKGNVNFSFSGLKTAISLLIKKNENFKSDENIKASLCFAIQDSIVANLITKLDMAVKNTGIENILITGGVSANQYLRNKAKDRFKNVYFPDKLHCMDNAAMIALTAGLRKANGLEGYSTKDVFCRNPIK